ncbi:MAG: ribosomal protein S18-alanine N-acetyltransferase [Lachnospiraceae bacterium]|nr:ribosomal protein S18-alanine N-acetyltransferase [Lachnospiraceae bacterium]
MEIRKITTADIDAVAKLEEENFDMPWKKSDFEDLIDKENRGCVVALEGDRVVGCVVYHNIVGDVDITNVQVKDDFRRKGIARELMKEAMKEARAAGGDSFTLEVRASNAPAIALYESLGFVSEGVRPNFYENPREDAVIMWYR